jgi:hypothetical protein
MLNHLIAATAYYYNYCDFSLRYCPSSQNVLVFKINTTDKII